MILIGIKPNENKVGKAADFFMNSNIITELRKQAEDAWIKHFNFCSEQNVWKTLDANLYDINIMGMSWKLRWIENQLNKISKENPHLL